MPSFPCIKRRIKILIVGQCKHNCGIQSYMLRQCSLLGPGLLMHMEPFLTVAGVPEGAGFQGQAGLAPKNPSTGG